MEFLWRKPRLGFLRRNFHFDQAGLLLPKSFGVPIEVTREFQPVERLNHVKECYGLFRFVGLEGTDEMKDGAGRGDPLVFCQRLLNTIFANMSHAGQKHGQHTLEGYRFRHREKRNRFRFSSGSLCSSRDAVANWFEAHGWALFAL